MKCYICGKENPKKLCSKRCMQVVIMRHRIRKFKESLVLWVIGLSWLAVGIYGLSLLP